MSNERIDLDSIESEWDKYQSDGPVDDYLASLNISRMIAELKRCYEKIDWLQEVADLAAANIGRKNWDVFEEAMYDAGLWERPSE
tara:strand:- start:358 stop:612 length:255 start_codon:yes stop_codon:yes gene_type:complete